MGHLLLHDPRIQFYLLCLGVLLVAVMWDYYLRNRFADSDIPGNEVEGYKEVLIPEFKKKEGGHDVTP
jgi:hypothetical protein